MNEFAKPSVVAYIVADAESVRIPLLSYLADDTHTKLHAAAGGSHMAHTSPTVLICTHGSSTRPSNRTTLENCSCQLGDSVR